MILNIRIKEILYLYFYNTKWRHPLLRLENLRQLLIIKNKHQLLLTLHRTFLQITAGLSNVFSRLEEQLLNDRCHVNLRRYDNIQYRML